MKMDSSSKHWLIAGAIVLVVGSAGYWYWLTRPSEPESVTTNEAPAAPASPSVPQYPIEANNAVATFEPLPSLADSDSVFVAALESLLPSGSAKQLLQPENAIRRWVVTIDALPKSSMSQRLRPVSRLNDTVAAEATGDEYLLAPTNYARYEPYLALAEQIDPQAAVGVYRRFYPLFQQAYADVVDPAGYFNDRLVAVIDHLLATREVTAPIALVRPSVMYQFADPALEALSVGQKMIIRMGPENGRRAKNILRALRVQLASSPTPELPTD
ncbi:MAG TPA: DUF3014 domain-containing protein [Steroidobacteraceae bacterium]|nr:DUF3014 domain-containing protein [Steroidobacteraceae bacterium]